MQPVQRLPIGHAWAIMGACLAASLHLLWGLWEGLENVSWQRVIFVAAALGGLALVLEAGRHLPWRTRWAGQALLWTPFALTFPDAMATASGIAYVITATTATAGELGTIRFRRAHSA